MGDRLASLVLSLLALATGCVYPAHEPTGLELSWRFFEGNPTDGEDSLRVRGCEGALVSTMWMNVYDDEHEDRRGTFRFPCTEGFQTITAFQTEASDAFLRLQSGTYRVELFSRRDDDVLDFLAERSFEVRGRGVTVEPWLLTRPTFDWVLELSGTEICQVVSMSLHYADPETMLPELAPEDGEEDLPVRYRDNLSSDLGIVFDGQELPCADLAGTHTVAQMDRGDYLLELAIDGRTCTVPLTLEPFSAPTMIDLESLPCDA